MGVAFAEAELDAEAKKEMEPRQRRIKRLFTDFARQAFGYAQRRFEVAKQAE